MVIVKGLTVMHTIYIRFLTQEDRVRGFYEMATRARISSLPGELYQVPIEALRILEDQKIAYRRATDAELKDAHDRVRDSVPAIKG
jgi:hypothetical protein